MSITCGIDYLKNEMVKAGIDSEQSLGTELFLFSSTLIPIINVDLLITDKNERILLSWREDPYHTSGWHVPGRCIRFKETFGESIQKCAQSELCGLDITFYPDPIKVYEGIRHKKLVGIKDQKERAHFVTLVFSCRISETISNSFIEDKILQSKTIKWFERMPEDMVSGQEFYFRDYDSLMKKIREIRNGKGK